MAPVPQPPVVLTVAGSDSGGGAGIQADLKTFAAFGVYGTAAIAALTAQDTRGVQGLWLPPPEFVAAQIDSVFGELSVDAVKIGMLGSSATIAAVAARLRAHGARRVVLDPVMIASSGAALLPRGDVALLREALLPLALVLTPNLPEAAALLKWEPARVEAEGEAACLALLELGPRAVLLKGGHSKGPVSRDLLHDGSACIALEAPRIATRNTHGTGCTLAAGLAAGLALGDDLPTAARRAKDFVTRAIEVAREWRLGRGTGPLGHAQAGPG
jgi:hydroxymethylpyrimidine/phosphomethylpyrimidine kinase